MNISMILGVIVSLISVAIGAPTCNQDFAPKPPLGFNRFDSYLNYLSEDQTHALINVMAAKYLPFG